MQKKYPDEKNVDILWIILPSVLGFLFIILVVFCVIGILRVHRKRNSTREVEIRESVRNPNINQADNRVQVVVTDNFNRQNSQELEFENNLEAPAPVEKAN